MATDVFRLHRDSTGELRFSDEARQNVAVTPAPAFPLVDPGHWISLRTSQGEEVALIEDPGSLPEPTRALLLEELRRVHFVPQVTRIHRITSGVNGLRIQIESDRGPSTVELDDDENIRRITEECVVIMDVRGIRYLIPDTSALDRHSRHCLDRYC